MVSVPRDRRPRTVGARLRERIVEPRIERLEWQARLFEHLRKAPVYRGLPQKLRPLWESACEELPSADARQWEITRLQTLSRQLPPRPALAAYLAELDTCVVRDLRLTSNGFPAHWARVRLHHDIEPRASVPRPEMTPLPVQEAVITITASLRGGYVELNDGAGRNWAVPPAEPMRFAEWNELREAAYEAVDAAIARMLAATERGTPAQRLVTVDAAGVPHESVTAATGPLRRKAAAQTEWLLDCERLALTVTGRRPVRDARERARLRRMAGRVGIDLPTRRTGQN